MATWGEFLKDFKITNMKGTVYIHADQVLDVWEERNNLRQEAAQLRQEAAQLRAQLGQERERCALDADEFAEAVAAEPEQPEHVAAYLRAVAQLIRDRGKPAEEPEGGRTEGDLEATPEEEVPLAEPVEESIPTAEPIAAELVAGEDIPTAEPVQPAEEKGD